jgi:hypothetical protein
MSVASVTQTPRVSASPGPRRRASGLSDVIAAAVAATSIRATGEERFMSDTSAPLQPRSTFVCTAMRRDAQQRHR